MSNNITVKDAFGNNVVFSTTDNGSGVQMPTQLIWTGVTPAPVAVANPFPVIQSVGTSTVLRAPISVSASGDTTIVPLGASKVIKVLGLMLISAATVVVTLKSSGGSSLTGPITTGSAGGGFRLDVTPIGFHWVQTLSGEALVLNLGTAVQVSGMIVYVQE